MQRKIKALFSLSVVFALFGNGSALVAYTGENSDSSEGTTTVINQTTTNQIVADSVKTQTVVTSETKRGEGKTLGYAAAQFVYYDKVKVFNIPVGYNVGYGFGIEATIPVMFVSQDISATNQDEKGLGDIALGVNYHFGLPNASIGLNIVSFNYKTTTGDEKKSLGSGAPAYILNYKYMKEVDKYMLHLQGSYTFNDKATINNTTFDYGDSYLISAGGSMPCLLSDKITTSAKLTYFHADAVDISGFMKSGKTDTADLWVQWDSTRLIENVPLGLGIKIPLKNEVDGSSIDKKFAFYLSVSGLF